MFDNVKIPKELIPSDPRFGVGPSLVPTEFLESLKNTHDQLLGTSHRKPQVVGLIKEVHDGLREYFSLPSDYEIIIGNGGATFFFDMLALGLVKDSSAHYVTGEFSNKWYLAHKKVPWIKTKKIEVAYGEGVNPEDVSGQDLICTTLNETSTGVIVTEIPKLNEHTLLAVDATSGGGQVHVDFKNVDVYFFSPQKVFASEGGTYIAILSPKAIKRAESLYDRDSYVPEVMNFKNAITNGRKYQTYNTPSISSIFYLNEQLKLMNSLGEKEVIKQSKEKADLVYSWAKSKDYLSLFVEDDKFRSNCVAIIDVDDKYSVSEIANFLRTKKIAYDIESYRKLNRNQLRISLFHNVKKEDIEKLCKIISLLIES